MQMSEMEQVSPIRTATYPHDYANSPMASLDLESIMYKLCHPTRGSNWAVERAKKAVEFYRRWLWLSAMYPTVNLSPSHDLDIVWHTHILDTRKYADDCELMFGRFMHHNPFSGLRDEQAAGRREEAYRLTKSLFLKHFGAEEYDNETLCCCGYCDNDVDTDNDGFRPRLCDLPNLTAN